MEWKCSRGVTPLAPPETSIVLLMPLSLPAGTGKVPYQFTSLGQATTEFSKPLDTSGLFKNHPGICFQSHPFLFYSGASGTACGSLPLLGYLGSYSLEPPEEE